MSCAATGLLVALLAVAPAATGDPSLQESQSQEPQPGALPRADLEWPSPWLSDVPMVDLSGTWRFDPEGSDPMVEAWRGREVLYHVRQGSGRIVLVFAPEDGRSNRQVYRWDGSVSRFERGDASVAERARWTEGGRVLEVVGRWWLNEEESNVHAYRFTYALRGDRLTFVQSDDSGTTSWHFQRARDAATGDDGEP